MNKLYQDKSVEREAYITELEDLWKDVSVILWVRDKKDGSCEFQIKVNKVSFNFYKGDTLGQFDSINATIDNDTRVIGSVENLYDSINDANKFNKIILQMRKKLKQLKSEENIKEIEGKKEKEEYRKLLMNNL